MLANKDTLEIEYLNDTSVKTLSSLQHLLPVPADSLKGQCIDIFHKNPQHQRKLLADASSLPHRAIIGLGDEKLSLEIAAIKNEAGDYLAPMLTWSVVTANIRIADNVAHENLSRHYRIARGRCSDRIVPAGSASNQSWLDRSGLLADRNWRDGRAYPRAWY